ncbi:MAG: tRNA pseudouridine(55) synthase TruB [Bacteroidetes bacterium GWF2_38_335]|nr:MAG: tRNA pseudouridine(55) synthase TruB [Bacteroidetes bacterium GWF2_38_335]HBS85818.1 tRNA pseudouridine(55) synthase TruB [Bacteroidales bacterium]
MNFIEGKILLIDKQTDWTSFDVVNKIRNLLKKHLNIKKIKVGHAGTLDPLASGLMIVCTGKETKNIDNYQALTKEYITTISLDGTTPSFDRETEVTETFDTSFLTKDKIQECLDRFKGPIQQVPPAYSAKKVDGQRAYIKARKNQDVELKPVEIVINELDLIDFSNPLLTIRINCSKGTYVRSLARDIGKELGCGGYLTELKRTAIGQFLLNDAVTVKEFEEMLNKN